MKQNKVTVTKALVVINVIWFFIVYLFNGMRDSESLLRFGAMTSDVIENGKYYQLITACFLHFNLQHAANNMIMLFALGGILEESTGKLRFLIIYLLAGVGGNMVSALWHTQIGQMVLSAGASGAVFGIEGAFLGMVLLNRRRLTSQTMKRVMICVVLSLYQGFAGQGIDNAAHVGGFVIGLLVMMISELLLKIFIRKDRVIGE